MSVPPKYKHDDLTPAFAPSLEHLMGKNWDWVHGNIHDAQRYVVNETAVVLIPRGYHLYDSSFENKRFDPALQNEI